MSDSISVPEVTASANELNTASNVSHALWKCLKQGGNDKKLSKKLYNVA